MSMDNTRGLVLVARLIEQSKEANIDMRRASCLGRVDRLLLGKLHIVYLKSILSVLRAIDTSIVNQSSWI